MPVIRKNMRKIEPRLTKTLAKKFDKKNIAGGNAVLIKTYRKLVEKTARLAYLNKDYLLFFRGQETDYKNRVGNSTFYPSIYREDYLPQRELNYRFDILNEACKKIKRLFRESGIQGYKEMQRKKYIQWSILQHYEVCKTPLLDITHSLRVACSFAQLDNSGKYAYVFIFALPYLTNRISINSEHDLVNIRLLSIAPPSALRPYYQEGYLAGTEDITNEYDSKSELDFNNRLVVKFKIPNTKSFWETDFKSIPKNFLYPDSDKVFHICNEIKEDLGNELQVGILGEFLKGWFEIEEKIFNSAKKLLVRTYSLREALEILLKNKIIDYSVYSRIDRLRKIRNLIVHRQKELEKGQLHKYIEEINSTRDLINKML